MTTTGVLEIGVLEPADSVDPAERRFVAKLRRGDPDAFEQLVRLHQDRLYDFCFRMLADKDEAADLVQEIFVSVHQNLRKFREDSRVSTWLYRIGKNHCLNRLKYLQRRGRGRSTEMSDVEESALAASMRGPQRPDEALDSAHERQRVQRAIARLEPEQRMLVVLRDIEGLTYDEIMDITELAEGTVKSRLHRAREKLAGLLRTQDGEVES